MPDLSANSLPYKGRKKMKDERFEIFYIRHADTSGARLAGKNACDVDISDLGEKQIRLLAERFAGCSFDAVFSSPLARAVKTAAAVAGKLDSANSIEIIPCLAENNTMNSGYKGADLSFLKQYYPDIILNTDNIYPASYPDGTDEENNKRAEVLISYFRKRFTYGQKILVFSHGSFGNAFIPSAVGIRDGDFIFSINNTSVTKIKYTPDGKQRISFMNDMSHLRPLMPDYEFSV